MYSDPEDDLEEELLAVAGRSRVSSGKKRARKEESSDEDYEAEERRVRKRPTSGKQTRAEVARDDEDLDSDFDDGYGSDLKGDESDRARLASMNELDREMELAERAEKRDKELERRRTARMLKQQQLKAAQASNMRSSTRQKGVDNAKRSAMVELVAAKNARARRTNKEDKWLRKDDEEEVSDESEYEVSDRSERDQSDEGDAFGSTDRLRDDELSADERDEEDGVLTRQYQPEEEAEDAEYKNIQEMQVRRYTLEKWQNEPFFERCLPGAVVRIAVGVNRYFMAQIVHVEEREPDLYKDAGLFRIESPYEFPDKAAKTHKWLYVQRGTSPRLMPMTLVSNHGISEDEFRSWRNQCDKDNRPQINMAEVDEVKQRLKDAATYVYTAEDVAKMVEDKRARGDVHNLAKEKSRLVVQQAKALEDGDTEEADRLAAHIRELDGRASERAAREEAQRAREAEAGRKSLAQVNKQNALRNMQNALKNVTSRPDGSASLTADGVDPFSRRQTRPMNYWSTRRRTPAEGVEGGSEAKAVEEVAPVEDLPTATATENEAGGIDLSIDLSILQQDPTAHLRKRLLGPNWAAGLPNREDFAGRKILTLTDYKRRQGIA